MSTNSFGFELETVASNYVKYRPTYPEEMYEKIIEYLDEGSDGVKRRGVAVDVGCGSCQSALFFAKSFVKVIGVDSSEAQLKEAKKATASYKNITYRQGTAETLSAIVDEGSVDLVTVGGALHWFDAEKFYSECLKVLKVGGTFAAFAGWPWIFDNEEATDIIDKVFKVTFKDYFPVVAEHVFNNYRELYALMPKYFRHCTRDDSMSYNVDYNFKEWKGFLMSIPHFHLYKADHPEEPDPLTVTIDKLQAAYGTKSMEDRVAKCSHKIMLLMGKK